MKKLSLSHREMMIVVIALKTYRKQLEPQSTTNTESIVCNRLYSLEQKIDELLKGCEE